VVGGSFAIFLEKNSIFEENFEFFGQKLTFLKKNFDPGPTPHPYKFSLTPTLPLDFWPISCMLSMQSPAFIKRLSDKKTFCKEHWIRHETCHCNPVNERVGDIVG
jgi:hypothetical protein